MTQDALARLLALAEKATPGTWELEHRTNAYAEIGVYDLPRKRWTRVADISLNMDNAEFLAACSPEVIAALVRVAMAAQNFMFPAWLNAATPLNDLKERLRALDAALAKER